MAAPTHLHSSSRSQPQRWVVRSAGAAAVLVMVLGACASSGTPTAGSSTPPATLSTDPSATPAPAALDETTQPATTAATGAPASAQPAGDTASTAETETASASTDAAAPAPSASGLTSLTVESTSEQYFVLYVRPDASSPLELPAAVIRGTDGTTTITDGRAALPEDRYRIATQDASNPGDVDGDGIDDLTELDDLATSNPLNAAAPLDPADGRLYIADRATYEEMSYQGDDVFRDGYLAGLEFVKFWITETDTDRPSVWFMNTENYRAHPMFAQAVGIPGGRGPQPGKMRGDIVWEPEIAGPDGTPGVFRFAFQPNDAYPFAEIALAYESLITSAPFLANDLMYYPIGDGAKRRYENEKALYDASRVPVLLEV